MTSTSSQDIEIAELNSTIKVRIAPSKIHGVGIFAIMEIPKGTRCYCVPTASGHKWYSVPWGSLNKLFPEVREIIVDQWPSIYNGSKFLSPNYTAWPILFMNHSSDPNFDNRSDRALKDISKGEELLEDYRTMDNWKEVFPWIPEPFVVDNNKWYNKFI